MAWVSAIAEVSVTSSVRFDDDAPDRRTISLTRSAKSSITRDLAETLTATEMSAPRARQVSQSAMDFSIMFYVSGALSGPATACGSNSLGGSRLHSGWFQRSIASSLMSARSHTRILGC